MKRGMFPLLAMLFLAGCATTPPHAVQKEKPGVLQRYSESRRLSSAVSRLQKSDSAGSARILEEICSHPAVPGVTDEALFRLALLSLKPSVERPASPHAQQLLKRLKKEFPASPWTVQATPLLELINSAEELKRQNRNYRGANQSLNKDVQELNRNIEQLKHLDLELEKKAL